LKDIKKYLENKICDKLKPTDNIVIVAPCHESNSQFINLINEIVFSSSATIIHYQNGVDFVENFSSLNKNYLTGENTKIFYVDDSLITGTHFLELFDLIRDVTEKDSPLTASILINDQAIPFIHDRAVRWSNNYFAFATYNQPPTLNITSKRPLEHERMRYELLQESALHDTLREHFYKKANKLNPEKCLPEKTESTEEKIRHLKMFEATHKIYDYFTDPNNKTVPNLTKKGERDKFVDFKLKYKKDGINIDDNDTNKKALLKVLSQYPFILYKDLRTNTFEWHKYLITEILESNPDKDVCFDMEKDYDKDFSTFKFRLRYAAFLGNYQVLEIDFIGKILGWFRKIDLYFIKKKNVEEQKQNDITDLFSKTAQEKLRKKEENLRDFPIFVLGNYIEMIQKNSWVAYHILKNVKKVDFNSSNQGRQFLCMLQLDAATVIDDFMEMINKDYRFKWRDMYKDLDNENSQEKLYLGTNKIDDFFKIRPDLLTTNKSLIIKETFLDNSDVLEKKEFVNYLWIKQLLYADCIDKDPHIPKEIRYQEKIDAIIEKMKGFFPEKNVQAFFIVTDGQEIPHVQYQQSDILNEFKKYYINHKYEVKEIEEEIK
ncbi:hypothetical protein, partial [Candidatus Symbiothrix dinenymphae]|uniref:hypothetical protein n=1 Tax=Candidatus Symbiothrix dinenymphae TaxID=467085 RepID=UPI0013159855